MKTTLTVAAALMSALSVACLAQPVDMQTCTSGGSQLPPVACEMMERAMAEDTAREAAKKQEAAVAAEFWRQREKEKKEASEREAERERLRPPPAPEKKIVRAWRSVEAANGAVFKLDMNSIARWSDGGVMAVLYEDQHTPYPQQGQEYHFDCRGRITNVIRPGSTTYAPPRSIGGRLSQIVCDHAKANSRTSEGKATR